MYGLLLSGLSVLGLVGKTAYLDPGSGSLILQLVLAAILGGFLVLTSYWKKVKDFLVGLFSRSTDEDDQDG